MREVKFRGLSEGKWYYGLLTFMFSSYAIVDPKDENTVHLVDVKTVGQYTGLKDENGVEIYEGDVVEAYFWNDKLKPVKKRGFIEFQSGSFIFNFGNGTWEYLDGNEAALVIGNIYEKPELLEDSAE